jgi:ABC-type molybdate transport system permease subunit
MKLLFLILFSVISAANCYKILGIFPFASASHYAIGEATLKALAEAGHEVTMISPIKTKTPMKNFKEIIIPDSFKIILKGEILSMFEVLSFLFIWKDYSRFY